MEGCRRDTAELKTNAARAVVPWGQLDAARAGGASVPAWLDGPGRQQEEKTLAVLMRVHPAATKPLDEMRQLRLLQRGFLKWQRGESKYPICRKTSFIGLRSLNQSCCQVFLTEAFQNKCIFLKPLHIFYFNIQPEGLQKAENYLKMLCN